MDDFSDLGFYGGDSLSAAKKFADPFLLPSSAVIPQTLETGLDMCLFLYFMNPQYRRASIRLVSHFSTRLEFTGEGDRREQDELKDLLDQGLDLPGARQALGEEWSIYGNGFIRIHFPFDRFLIDDRSGKSKFYALDMFKDQKYIMSEMLYDVPDPTKMKWDGTATQRVKLPFFDKPSMDVNRIALRKLDPRRCDLQHSWISGKTQVVYRFEEWFVKQIKDGNIWQVNETPLCMLRALKDGDDFMFNEDEIFHFKAPTVSGISNNGWGLPETLANFRALHQVQVLRKVNEAVGMDYMLPFRIFSPGLESTGAGMDTTEMMIWQQFVSQMIKDHRKDPFAMHAMPTRIQYDEVGGNGRTLAPYEAMQYGDTQLMEAMGIPAELWKGSLKVETIPTTLRLFENSFHFIYRGFDNFSRWVVRRVLSYLNREQIGVRLQLPSMADDIEERNVYLQLAAGGEISRQKAYRPFGVEDPVQEAKARMQEDIEIQRAQQKLQNEEQRRQQMGSIDQVIGAEQQQEAQEMAQQQQGAGASPGAAQATPLNIQDDADKESQRLLGIQDQGQRTKELRQLESSNKNLYYAVKGKMEEARREGASQGRKQVGQQQQQPQQ